MHRPIVLLLLATGLAACTLSLPGKAPEPASAAINPGAVSVTILDDAPAPANPTASGPTATITTATTTTATPATTAATRPPARPAPLPEPQPATTTAAPTPPAPAPDATDSPAPSPGEIACTAKGGQWSATGASSLRTCLMPARDAGKSCRKKSDCDGLCLARSRTCAPVIPLFGCNEVLQDDGSRATLCID